jgi:peptide/nickel transport system permease protein
MFVALGYETRFYRSIVVEEMSRDHVRTARAFGCPSQIFFRNILKNCPFRSTRIMFSIQVAIGGALLIGSYFGIRNRQGHLQAIITGDQPVLKTVVS